MEITYLCRHEVVQKTHKRPWSGLCGTVFVLHRRTRVNGRNCGGGRNLYRHQEHWAIIVSNMPMIVPMLAAKLTTSLFSLTLPSQFGLSIE